jgi:hypothetical protein
MRLFLDDVRKAPSGWIPVRTAVDAIRLLETGMVHVISLDHDLGTKETGYDVACWIEAKVMLDPNFHTPRIEVHSANPVGAARIRACIDSIERIGYGS